MRKIWLYFVFLMAIGMVGGCDADVDTDVVGELVEPDVDCQTADSLNMAAYRMRYVSVDSVEGMTKRVLNCAEKGSAEWGGAMCNLGFVKYMRMQYEEAKALYEQCYKKCDDDVTKLMACVGMMRICQATASNKEYFDHAMHAEQLLDIPRPDDEEGGGLTLLLRQTEWNYAHSEFYITSSAFYSSQLMDSDARRSIRQIRENQAWVEKDTAQLARYYTICSYIGLGSTDMNIRMQYLTEAYVTARQNGLRYIEAHALQSMADLLINEEQALDIFTAFSALWECKGLAGDSLGRLFAERALDIYKDYGSAYSQGMAYLTISSWYLNQGDATAALDVALMAEELAVKGPKDKGKRTDYRPMDWIGKVHEHLSRVYASLGDKQMSDENRNAYLDILDETRQDKQFEQRKEVLEDDQQRLSVLKSVVYTVAGLIAVGCVIGGWLVRRRRRYNRQRREELMEEEKAVLELRLKKNKRSYIDKCTSLSIVNGIMPFLSRAIRAIQVYQRGGGEEEQRAYAEELFCKINEYNDILTHWIKMKQGVVKLHVESFALQPLFDTLEKNRSAFEQKGIELRVGRTDAVVKADRTLTLFMMNTLMDNARKFTDQGYVELKADEGEDYVEISIKDTGVGMVMSEEEMYSDRKGFGFGLMNCKGIIEKYRKTSRLFDVCRFDMDSRVGEGSRFAFRLPKVVGCWLLASSCWLTGGDVWAENKTRLLEMDIPDDVALMDAHRWADSTYYANVRGDYEGALEFGDSVIEMLNRYYLKKNADGSKLMVANGGRYMPELEWWDEGFVTDYVTILDVRNEMAIAALALNEIRLYKYNNNVYARLYKLCGQDKNLEQYCEALTKTSNDTRWAIGIVVVLVLVGVVIFYLVQRYLNRLSMEISDEENRRIEYEDNNLHVQNMILDNCLSTIKHETMYYPSKILNILNDRDVKDLKDAEELALYYEKMFSLLSEHATRQLERVQFKRKTLRCRELVEYFYEKAGMELTNDNMPDDDDMNATGDKDMLMYLMDNLVDIAREHDKNGKKIRFYFVRSEGFVKFAFEDENLSYDDEEISRLFYPDNLKYDRDHDVLVGAQLIICKQIIREHDEHCGHRGCQIYAEKMEEGGTRIQFMIPSS